MKVSQCHRALMRSTVLPNEQQTYLHGTHKARGETDAKEWGPNAFSKLAFTQLIVACVFRKFLH